jgi:hypothetical protein
MDAYWAEAEDIGDADVLRRSRSSGRRSRSSTAERPSAVIVG